MTWSSTRSVVGLLIALSIPPALPDGTPFRERDLILAMATCWVVGSVLVQGLSLRKVVEYAALAASGDKKVEEDVVRNAMRAAAVAPGAQHETSFDAARQVLIELRERYKIGDEMLVRMLRETDLLARSAEEDTLPGAGPPNT